jgi:single-stranded-DNA-specific exonuclease
MSQHTKKWKVPKRNQALREIFSLKLGISQVVAQILVNRGITTLEDAKVFLSADKEALHDPFLMKDMDKGVNRIRTAITEGEKIRVFGDYDVDGITSTSILIRVLKKLGADVDYYIPERLTEGYGMNSEAVNTAKAEGISLIITVDSGISAFDEVALACDSGIDVIITDHHEPPDVIPMAKAVINPKQKDCTYPFKELAGAGVALKLGQALIGEKDIALMESMIELACLGTIADIVPLKGENRILAKNGISSLPGTKIIGLRALMDQCGIDTGDINSRQIAFQIAPKINAAGRLGDANIVVKLLLSDKEDEATTISAQLCAVNEERQGIEAAIYKEALRIIEGGGVDLVRDKVIVLAREGWHLGVIGIVASKLVQEFYRPVVLLSIDGNTAKGSARSIPALNIFETFKSNKKYLEKYGGHRQAAGLTINVDNIAAFSEGINRYAENVLTEENLMPEVYVDDEVVFSDIDNTLYRQLQLLAPYGCENPSPLLVCRGAEIIEHRTVGSEGSHLKMKLRDRQFMFDAIGFNLGCHHHMIKGGEAFDIVFSVEKNEWKGRSFIQLNIKDIKPAVSEDTDIDQPKETESVFIEELFHNAVIYLTDDYYRDIADKEEFYTKVAGVTFDNRQTVVEKLYEGEKLYLFRDPNNPYDGNAVKVENSSGQQVGFLNARLAKHFALLLDRGEQYLTYVSQVTGGKEKNYGVNIVIQRIRPECREEYKQRMAKIRGELLHLSDLELMERIRLALLGEYPFREKQIEAIDRLFEGFNTLTIFGTGRGKSVVFQATAAFKALRDKEMTVIVYPLRALVNDQHENMSARLEQLGLRVFKGNGSISSLERAMLFDAIENNEIDVFLTTPEFVTHHLRKIQAMSRKAGLFVVDESHHIGMSSQVHRPVYKRLGELAGKLGQPVILAVTATANNEVAAEIIETLKIDKVVIDPHIRTNLQVVDKRDWHDKNGYLKSVIQPEEKTIIYVNSRLQSVELAAMLREVVPRMADKIIYYHAGLSSEQRNIIEKMFREGKIAVVVSTSAFGEGIDIPDVKNIVVFHLNFSFTEYNQQCGRCGRDGDEAKVHILCGRRDAALNQFILESSSPDRDSLAKLYLVLKELAVKAHPITQTNEDIAKTLRLSGVRYARPNLISAGLGVLEELELIQRESSGRDRQIYIMPSPEEKTDMVQSLRFIEGEEEKKAFQEFQEYFFRASAEELLSFINRPIYPHELLDKQAGSPS